MDAFVGILGAVAFLTGFYALVFRAVRRGSRASIGSLGMALIGACMVMGIGLVAVAWHLSMNGVPPAHEAEAPIVVLSDQAAGDEASGITTIGLLLATAATAAVFFIAWWLAFGIIPDILTRRQRSR